MERQITIEDEAFKQTYEDYTYLAYDFFKAYKKRGYFPEEDITVKPSEEKNGTGDKIRRGFLYYLGWLLLLWMVLMVLQAVLLALNSAGIISFPTLSRIINGGTLISFIIPIFLGRYSARRAILVKKAIELTYVNHLDEIEEDKPGFKVFFQEWKKNFQQKRNILPSYREIPEENSSLARIFLEGPAYPELEKKKA